MTLEEAFNLVHTASGQAQYNRDTHQLIVKALKTIKDKLFPDLKEDAVEAK